MTPNEFKALLAKCGDYTIDDGERADAQHDAYQFVWGNAEVFAELWAMATEIIRFETRHPVLGDDSWVEVEERDMKRLREVLAKLEAAP